MALKLKFRKPKGFIKCTPMLFQKKGQGVSIGFQSQKVAFCLFNRDGRAANGVSTAKGVVGRLRQKSGRGATQAARLPPLLT
jgi:hypothetical protein